MIARDVNPGNPSTPKQVTEAPLGLRVVTTCRLTRAFRDSDKAVGTMLVEAVQHGDRDAFGQLYDRYRDVVFRFVAPRVANRVLAQDFTSETFLRALTGIDSYTDTGQDIGAWLVTIARNLILDHLKSNQYKLEMTVADMFDTDSTDRSPEQTAIDRDGTRDLHRLLMELDADQRHVIELRFLAELTVAETAVTMGRGVSAVKSLQHRATRRLAALMGVEGKPRICAHVPCTAVTLTANDRYCSTPCRTTAAELVSTGRLTPSDRCQTPDCHRRLTASQRANHALYCGGVCRSRAGHLRSTDRNNTAKAVA